jgi:ABC-type glycerol-3-phosphate transport system permease component
METLARPLAVSWRTLLRYLAMTIIAVLMLIPMVWMFVSSIRPASDIFQYTSVLSWRTLIPEVVTLDNYREVFFQSDFPRALYNSLLIGVVTVIAGIFVNSAAGFAFAVFEFPFKRALFLLVMVTFMVPFESIVIPLYHLIRELGWVNSYKALIVPAIANGFVIFLFRQFVAALPKELYEAARVDGASWWQIYWRIVLPLSFPTIVTAALMMFILQWESFFWPLVAASGDEYTVVQVALARHTTAERTAWGRLFGSLSITVLIPMVLYLLAQRFYIRTVAGTGMK